MVEVAWRSGKKMRRGKNGKLRSEKKKTIGRKDSDYSKFPSFRAKLLK
jgi:hypothetical protein